MNKDELQDAYDEILEAVQEAVTVMHDERWKLSGKMARIAELLEPFADYEEDEE